MLSNICDVMNMITNVIVLTSDNNCPCEAVACNIFKRILLLMC